MASKGGIKAKAPVQHTRTREMRHACYAQLQPRFTGGYLHNTRAHPTPSPRCGAKGNTRAASITTPLDDSTSRSQTFIDIGPHDPTNLLTPLRHHTEAQAEETFVSALPTGRQVHLTPDTPQIGWGPLKVKILFLFLFHAFPDFPDDCFS